MFGYTRKMHFFIAFPNQEQSGNGCVLSLVTVLILGSKFT